MLASTHVKSVATVAGLDVSAVAAR